MVNSCLLRSIHGKPRLPSRPVPNLCHAVCRHLHQAGHTILGSLREEQTLPRFYEKQYYPVRIGQTFHDRYKILTKLGYGAYSTVWLVRDQKTDQYTSLKICTRHETDTSPVANELSIFRHMKACSDGHAGATLARLPDDVFEVDSHICLVMKPHACSLQHLQNSLAGAKVPDQFITAVVMRLLACVNWLQLDCGVVHTGLLGSSRSLENANVNELEITPQNILLSADDDEIFRRAEKEEIEHPSVPVFDHTHPYPHPIYQSRGQPTSLSEALGHSILTDFGSAKLLKASTSTRGWWMPDTYRAPEILMGLPWDHSVDIWSIGVMVSTIASGCRFKLTQQPQVLELLEGRNLFDPIDRTHNQYVLPLALAQYIGYMGLPPLWMIQQSDNPTIATFFDNQGRWIAEPPIRKMCFEDFLTVIPPSEKKTQLVNFVKKIFTWSPAERANSAELFEDEWLTAPYKGLGILGN